jgi:ABC-type histidine transport system ATPase subunit
MATVEFLNVHKSFGDVEVLKGINRQVPANPPCCAA